MIFVSQFSKEFFLVAHHLITMYYDSNIIKSLAFNVLLEFLSYRNRKTVLGIRRGKLSLNLFYAFNTQELVQDNFACSAQFLHLSVF